MKKLLLIFFTFLVLCGTAKAEFFPDIIVTSSNGIWTDSRAYDTLNAAVTAVGTNKRTVVISSQQVVTSLTIPSNITLKFERDGSIANSGQLTINTKDIIADNHQIFTGTGDIDFSPGSVIKSSWFSTIMESLSQTLDDSLTLIISKSAFVTTDCAVGNNVNLRWESPRNQLTINAGITMSNISDIEAGNFQLFAGAGNFNFVDGTKLRTSWFNSIRSAITWIDTDKVTLALVGTNNIDYNVTIPSTILLDFKSANGEITFDPGVSVTFENQEVPLTGFPNGLYNLISSIVNSSLIINIDKSDTLTLDTIIPSNVFINFQYSSILTISAGKTLTLNSPNSFNTNGIVQRFSGTVIFTNPGIIYPDYFQTNTAPGTTDMTNAIDIAISSGAGTIKFVPDSSYLVDLNTFDLTSNMELVGSNSTLISSDTTRDRVMFYGKNLSNIKIHGLTFSTHNSGQLAIQILACEGFEVYDCKTIKCALLETGSASSAARISTGYYTAYATATLGENKNINVHNNIIEGDSIEGVSNLPGIIVSFMQDGSIRNNKISGLLHGIMYWGGDSNPAIDGAIANQRKVKTLLIKGNILTDIEYGDIWGSMGDDIKALDNFCDWSGDAGLDFEGSTNCQAIGNTVKNRTSIGIGAGFICRNILFTGNYVETDTNGVWLINTFGAADEFDNQNISFTNNDVVATGNIIGLISGSSSFDGYHFNGNRLTNMRFDQSGNKIRNVSINDNTWTYTWDLNPAIAVIALNKFTDTGADCEIDVLRNKVIALIPLTENNSGFYSDMTAATFGTDTYNLTVAYNDFSAVERPWSIGVDDTVANAANLQIGILYNKIKFSAYPPIMDLETAGYARVYRGRNYYNTPLGIEYPNGIPTTGKWFAGEFTISGGAGFFGSKCTITGVPGTWIDFGELVP